MSHAIDLFCLLSDCMRSSIGAKVAKGGSISFGRFSHSLLIQTTAHHRILIMSLARISRAFAVVAPRVRAAPAFTRVRTQQTEAVGRSLRFGWIRCSARQLASCKYRGVPMFIAEAHCWCRRRHGAADGASGALRWTAGCDP